MANENQTMVSDFDQNNSNLQQLKSEITNDNNINNNKNNDLAINGEKQKFCFSLRSKFNRRKVYRNNEMISENFNVGDGKQPRLARKTKINYACLCLFAFLTGCDFAVIIPTLWDRLSNDYNGTGVFMGFVISAYSLCGVISGFIMGKMSDDMKNTKIFYLVSILFAIFGQCLYFFGISKYFILLSRCICGVSLGASPVALAYIARTTTEKQRTSIISLIMASRQIGIYFVFM
jgi:hypothetical protein